MGCSIYIPPYNKGRKGRARRISRYYDSLYRNDPENTNKAPNTIRISHPPDSNKLRLRLNAFLTVSTKFVETIQSMFVRRDVLLVQIPNQPEETLYYKKRYPMSTMLVSIIHSRLTDASILTPDTHIDCVTKFTKKITHTTAEDEYNM